MVSLQSQVRSSTGVLLRGISWQTYQALSHELIGEPGKRLTYDDGCLEILIPLPPHESVKRRLGRLVEIVTEELNIEIRSLSATTWRREDLRKGVEADECYYIANEAQVRGKMELDLSLDPPPDLVIEVEISSPSLSRLEIYRVLGVPEVWRFQGGRITVLVLQGQNYQEADQSLALPLLSQHWIQSWLSRAAEMGETSWTREVRSWVREQQSRESS